MATRETYTSASDPAPTGPELVDQYNERFTQLFNAIILEPTSISNSGNDYTIVIDPELEDVIVNGMAFYITPNAANTGAARLRVTSSGAYYDWTDKAGDALASGDLDTTVTYLVAFLNGEFRTLTEVGAAASGGGATFTYEAFTASGTWNKPAGLNDNAWALVEAWGGGGGGGTGIVTQAGGGGGGAYAFKFLRGSELGSSETVTVGAGGSSGSAGGQTSFGSLVSAFGGGAGGAVNLGAEGGGGGGGGATSVGSNGSSGNGGAGGLPGKLSTGGETELDSRYGGCGGDNVGGDDEDGGSSVYGGGGGGGGGTADPAGDGGDSLYGGGGGAGGSSGTNGTAGTSTYGGNGGGESSAGSAPAGGGGAGAAGARGEVRVWVIG